ncbi:MAG: SET domain-containing protein [Planctomycetota bacterium]
MAWPCRSATIFGFIRLTDDCGNHSCNPNAGFITGEPILYALRDIDVGEEIT